MIYTALAVLAVQASVLPQHIQAYARLDTVSSYAVASAACEPLGYQVSDDFADVLQKRAVAEAEAAGAPTTVVNGWVEESVRRAASLFQQDLDRTLATVKAGSDPGSAVNRMYDAQAEGCARIAADPISFGILTAGAPDEMRAARIKVADELLAGYGKASWQTPVVWARGELLMALGICKARMPAAQHDQLLAEHLPASQAQDVASRWIAGQYLEGLRSATDLGLDVTQCGRLMRSRQSDMAKARA